jgi:sRNA-binding carbon storage regulator CsrA
VLILTRKPGQRVRIEPAAAVDPGTTIGELFADGPIELVVTRVSGHRVRLGIVAPAGLVILREEIREMV